MDTQHPDTDHLEVRGKISFILRKMEANCTQAFDMVHSNTHFVDIFLDRIIPESA